MKKVILITLFIVALFQLKAQDPKGQTIISTIAPTDSLDDYYTHDDYFGKTATKIVKTLTQRDNLPTSRRQLGMKVYVQEFSTWFRLEDCIDNNCWIIDRIDTLWNGTHSTGRITVQPSTDGSTFLYDAYNYQGYQRFGVTKNGLLLAGRRMPLAVNVDALAWIGDRNELLATDGIVIGKDNIVNGDTAAAFGYNLESNKYNALIIGRGANRSNRVKSRWMRSVNIGAFQTIPQIELTQDTIRLNSSVLWWNGSPVGGGDGSVDSSKLVTRYNLYTGLVGDARFQNNYGSDHSFMNAVFGGIYLGANDGGSNSHRIDITSSGITFINGVFPNFTQVFFNNSGLTYLYNYHYRNRYNPRWIPDKNYVDSLVTANASGAETDPIFNASAAKNITSGEISTWNNLISFPGFGTSNSTAATGDHLHTGLYQPLSGAYNTSNLNLTSVNFAANILTLAGTGGAANIKGHQSFGHIVIDGYSSTHSVWLQEYNAGDVYMAYAGGKVGIGLHGANYKLDVSGDINIRGSGSFRINGTPIVSFPGFGSTNATAAYGDHNHNGVYQPAGSYALSSHNHSGVYQPVSSTDGGSVSGSSSGNFIWNMESHPTMNHKRIMIYCSSLSGTASLTFPFSFQDTPAVLSIASGGASPSVITSLSSTSLTITGSNTSGYLILEGF